MTKSKNDPIALELSSTVVDMLAQYARADGESMRLAVRIGEPGAREAWEKAEQVRKDLADGLVMALFHCLPNFSAEGDFADAINERDEAYDAYRQSKPAR